MANISPPTCTPYRITTPNILGLKGAKLFEKFGLDPVIHRVKGVHFIPMIWVYDLGVPSVLW